MAETTNIEWCDKTFNPHMGCTKVSAACTHCYAERDMDKRLGKVAWGPSGTRVVTSDANWRKPIKWNRAAGDLPSRIVKPYSHPIKYVPVPRPRVFCASLADVFEDWQSPIHDHQGYQLCLHPSEPDRFVPIIPSVQELTAKEIDQGWRPVTMNDVRARLFRLIDATPNLDWLILTKRPENIGRMWRCKNDTDGDGNCASCRHGLCRHRSNVWLGTSTENQEQADKRIPELLKSRDLSPVLFLSCEPLLGKIEFSNVSKRADAVKQLGKKALDGIDWVIAGGESGPKARSSHPAWFRSIRDQCKAVDVPFLFKQWGIWSPKGHAGVNDLFDYREQVIVNLDGSITTGLLEYGDDAYVMNRVGKKNAGRLLDGIEHNEFPQPTL